MTPVSASASTHAVIAVKDLARATGFYSGRLGLTASDERSGTAVRYETRDRSWFLVYQSEFTAARNIRQRSRASHGYLGSGCPGGDPCRAAHAQLGQGFHVPLGGALADPWPPPDPPVRHPAGGPPTTYGAARPKGGGDVSGAGGAAGRARH